MNQTNPYEKTGFVNFDELYKHSYQRVRSFISRLTRNDVITEDLVQETFMTAFQSLGRYKEGNVYGWLCGIARHKVMDYFRKDYLEQRRKITDEVAPSEAPTPEQEAASNETRAGLEQVISRSLGRSESRILRLCAEGYKPREISKRLKISDVATRQRIHRLRKRIEEHLEKLQ